MSPSDPSPIGRLAPSPTGRLHLGHARTFLLAWWHLRSHGGRVLLRMEDLDRERVRPGYTEDCLRDLEWLGLDWDGAPLLQSADTGALEAAVVRLLEADQAYLCGCSRRDIRAAQSAPHADETELRYPGTCRSRASATDEPGRPLAARLRVPAGPIELDDGVVGPFHHDVQAEVGDFLLARRDGFFAYQLSVVVDDARSGVTWVHRGADLLSSTTRQWHLQRALGLPHPRWFHLPLVRNEQGERLAKRRDDLALTTLRESAVDPRAVVAWAARSAGLEVPDRLSAREVLPGFSPEALSHAPLPMSEPMLGRLLASR